MFLISKKDACISKNIGVRNGNKTTVFNFPDISSLIYYKAFWSKQFFEEVTLSTLNDTPQILYKFIINRKECILFKPFILHGFKINFHLNNNYNNIENIENNIININCNLLINKELKESFNLTFV